MTSVMIRAAFSLVAVSWAACASAQEKSPPADAGTVLADQSGADTARQRFRFSKVGEGMLRLDGETGQVSYCSARAIGWGCQLVPDDRAALETEIARLQDKADALSKEVAELRANDKASAVPRPPEPVPPTNNGTLKLPNRDDLDRAKIFLDDAWRRLVEMFEQWRKELGRT